jgi:8-oxo-dGTP diphosphatase
MMIKRYGDVPKSGQAYTRRPGVYAILHRNGEVLLTHQAVPSSEIQLPGGGIDAGENPIAALHREVYEETGWHMALQFKFGTFRRFAFMPEYNLWAEKICTIYVGRPTMQMSAPTEPDHMPLWMPAKNAASVLGNPGDRAMMESFARLAL